ncbi:hypothetical protein [Anaerostipes sp.]|uniref:hypothetical protein n=1 Tax=Anaerostipes sp. TaxID=1872530 RepID=UPI0025B8EC4C|nr:hypothetical protein [Anaerostipes sp.]MBS7008520.1 hypothetical protein [Anaerostipes sp.]
MDDKVNRKERVVFLIGLVPVFWMCFKITGKVTQEQIKIFTTNIGGSLIKITPLFVFYCGLTATFFIVVSYIFLYLMEQDNLRLFNVPLKKWEDRMYHMVILSSIVTVILSILFCVIAVFVIERNVFYFFLVLVIICFALFNYYFLFHRKLSIVKIKILLDDLILYTIIFALSLSFAAGVISSTPEVTVETRFSPKGKIDIYTKSDKDIDHILVQIYSAEEEKKIAEKKEENYSTSGFYQVFQRKSVREVKQKEESRTYTINLVHYKEKLIPLKKYYVHVFFDFEDKRYFLENEFSVENKDFRFKENKMKYKYTE